ncbi:serine acetyltransferase [Flagellimonas olearia]|uniref:Serine acetyltransferase n=1 Tax=Flagellimonas olearia TaxID=552546 RepID=A0A6I1E3L7_9FLAO|nr:serine acetyltransferase [Allomuricauda olearia]KAB7530490.1 serine acetyltransferase [Allomuricauda olearia]
MNNKSKEDYKQAILMDSVALGMTNPSLKSKIKNLLSPYYIYNFQMLMRKVEYYSTKTSVLSKLYCYYLKFRYKKLSLKLGFSIPPHVFGPGLSIVHYGTIVINQKAQVGKNCRIHACVNIGASGGDSNAPKIGDNVYIAPGAKIYGNITIANNIAIGANAVVNRSFEEEGILIAGNPAKKIKEIDISRIIKHIKA